MDENYKDKDYKTIMAERPDISTFTDNHKAWLRHINNSVHFAYIDFSKYSAEKLWALGKGHYNLPLGMSLNWNTMDLEKWGLIKPEGGRYILTDKGKEYLA